MPIHTYFCNNCFTKKTLRIKFDEIENTVNCPNCYKAMVKQLQVPNVHYKGEGFTLAVKETK